MGIVKKHQITQGETLELIKTSHGYSINVYDSFSKVTNYAARNYSEKNFYEKYAQIFRKQYNIFC